MMIIVNILNIVCYSALTFLAGYTCIRIHRLSGEIDSLGRRIRENQAYILSLKLQNDLDQIYEMQKILRDMVEEEDYEGAERLQAAIDKHRKAVLEQLDRFKQRYGNAFNFTRVEI